MKVFDFKEENKKGMKGEEYVMKKWGWKRLTKTGPDFRTRYGKIIELKTDYVAARTGNIFVERWSNFERKTVGGPFRSFREKCDYFSTLVWKKELISFKPLELISYLEELGYTKEDLKPVKNKNYTTKGWAVPIFLLKKSPDCIVTPL